ncbi:MAG: cation diffusion facilitator family transporter [Acidobacteriota bacterium]|jgi:cation diffusion facilitator family transporter
MSPPSLRTYAWLSIAAAVATIALKVVAWAWTGSVGLLSDALESLVNLAGAMMALAMLTVAARPADEDHAFGHGKAEYFASGFEGVLILGAAIGIGIAAVDRLLHPRELESLATGVAVSVLASAINLWVARTLLAAGRRHGSITLEADARHLMTDVWTSAGVLAGVGAVALTGRLWLDPAIALLVAINILWTGYRLVARSAAGLMDVALPEQDLARIQAILDHYRAEGIEFHALRTRQAGARAFLSVHVLVPGAWTVQEGHDLVERLEGEIRAALPRVTAFTHLEPQEDPAAHADLHLDR